MKEFRFLENLIVKATIRVLAAVVVFLVLFFLPAGTFNYWQAWVYLVVMILLVTIVMFFLNKTDPELLQRRLESREKHREQNIIITVVTSVIMLIFIIPGFDRRFGWSNVPIFLVILADVFIILSYGFIALVLRENSFAARTVRVEKNQKVTSSGPYSIVRHPMYLGMLVFFLFTPLALGSWWAVLPALLIVPILVARILNEEKILIMELNGYKDYMKATRFRLFPGIW